MRQNPTRFGSAPITLLLLLSAGIGTGAPRAQAAGTEEAALAASWRSLAEQWIRDHPSGACTYRLRVDERAIDAAEIAAFRERASGQARATVDSLATELARPPLHLSVTETLEVDWPAFKQAVDGSVTEGDAEPLEVRSWKVSDGREVLIEERGGEGATHYKRQLSQEPLDEPSHGLALYQGAVARIRSLLDGADAAGAVTQDGPQRFSLQLGMGEQRRSFERQRVEAARAGGLLVELATEVRGRFEVRGGRAEFVLSWSDSTGKPLLRTAVVWRDGKPLSLVEERFVPGSELVRTSSVLKVAAGWPTKPPTWTPAEGAVVLDTRFGGELEYTVGEGASWPSDEDLRARSSEQVDGDPSDAR